MNKREGLQAYTEIAQPTTRNRPTHPEYLTVAEVCIVLGISRSTWDKWRANQRGPRCHKLPNGQLLIARKDLDHFMLLCREAG